MSRLPSVRVHVRGYFFIRISGKDHYLGKDRAAANAQAKLLLSEYLRDQHFSQKFRPITSELTIEEIAVEYLCFAKTYYVGSERSADSFDRCRLSIKPLVQLCGKEKPSQFGPLALKRVRERFVAAGLACSTVNDRVNIIRQCFRWAVENEFCDSSVYQALKAVRPLQPGRSSVKVGKKVKSVSLEVVEQTILHLSPIIADLVRFQLHSGMRSSEMLKLRLCDIDQSRPIWRYSPAEHKTAWKEKERVVYFGPQCQEILGKYIGRVGNDAERYLFSPKDAVADHNRKRAAERKTPRQASKQNRPVKETPKRTPGDKYRRESYRTAILRACDRAGVERWFPHQLRHLAGTLAREVEGLDGSQHFLGHSNSKITEQYAEIRDAKGEAVARKIG